MHIGVRRTYILITNRVFRQNYIVTILVLPLKFTLPML
nr:MAG TPA: hypothetical protein [Inoviridae sp.]